MFALAYSTALPIILALVMLAVRRLSRNATVSTSAAISSALLASLAIALSAQPAVCWALWTGVSSVGGVLLGFIGADYLASHAFNGLTGAIRGLPWLLENAITSIPSMALALAVAFAVQPLINAGAQQRVAQLLPLPFRPLATNGWSTHRTAWRENAVVLALCLVPILGVGIVAAIYLRLKRPDRLWPLTWVATVLAVGGLVGALVSNGAWIMIKRFGLKFLDALPLLAGPLFLIPVIVSSVILAATMSPTAPTFAAERTFRWVLLLHVPFLLLVAWWVFVVIAVS